MTDLFFVPIAAFIAVSCTIRRSSSPPGVVCSYIFTGMIPLIILKLTNQHEIADIASTKICTHSMDMFISLIYEYI